MGSRAAEPQLLLSILMLEIWLSTYLPRAVERPERAPDRELITL